MAATAERMDLMERTWQQPPGLLGWLTAVNHRAIGTRYLVTGFVFFLLAGVAALLMRIQLAYPEMRFLNADAYNQLFTMHGTTMMFLFAVPIMEGIGILIVPLMLGARDLAFPRLNALGYWCYLIGGVALWLSLLFGRAPDAGWFSYVPLADATFSPGIGIDIWATSIAMIEVAALVAAVEIIVTTFTMRAPGISLNRIPIFVWALLITSIMIVFAMPTLMTGSIMLEFDRTLGTNFFNPAQGGESVLWQHIFWFFGHPEVYIMFLPGLGIVGTIVATFSRRPHVAYTAVVLSIVATGFLGFGVWVHHMFASGLSHLGMSLFSIMSFLIAIPSGVQVFAGIATLWYGKPWLQVPLLYVIGFYFIFVLGGITGVVVASIPVNLQVHDTYFVVAHFHYVIIGGVVFPLLAGAYYWFPKITGRMPDHRLGVASFILTFVGMNLTFFPMHLTGFWGMPRRVYTYLAGLGWGELNLISTIGAFVIASGFVLFLANLLIAWRRGEPAPANPWGSGTLEWATESPPEPYNFRYSPVVRDRYPLWYEAVDGPEDAPRMSIADTGEPPTMDERTGILTDRRETLGTTLLDAVPQQRVVLTGPSLLPLFLALAIAVVFLGFAFDPLISVGGAVLVTVLLILWNRPDALSWKVTWARAGSHSDALPTSITGSAHGIRTPLWWGIVSIILIEAVVFAVLIASYLYLRAHWLDDWPVGRIDAADLVLPTIGAVILWLTIVPNILARRYVERGEHGVVQISLAVALVMLTVFLVLKVYEYSTLDYNWTTNAYASVTWTIVAFHAAHVLALMIKTSVVLYYSLRGYFTSERFEGVVSNSIYAYFVIGIWVPLYLLLYFGPRVL